ncbi:hypothetical protein SAMN05428970_0637 [Agromyces sp. CF514]|uniref:hypothetical protein n=1 Tax=Agromyces sp. CF514 TaxID=1881031 RepID=UPI0008EE0A91|nr:hypothetical protein [Agromyces sp. CF514]SFR69228.1 hypothetical protein SAMN05428970_0637 [Agromyces sp. CF514]
MSAVRGSRLLLARVRGPENDLAFAVTDAACWVAVLTRPGAAGDPVGVFRAECSAAEADAAWSAATAALDASTAGVGGDTGWLLDLDGHADDVPHTIAVEAGLDAAVDPLITRALDSPVGAVRLEVHVVDVPGMGAMLGCTLATIGAEPVVLLLDAERFAVTLDTGDAVTLAPPSLGLVDGDGSFRDGIRATAELPAGSRASCSFPLAALTAAGVPDANAIAAASLSGWLALVGPWAGGPMERFVLRAPAQIVPSSALG